MPRAQSDAARSAAPWLLPMICSSRTSAASSRPAQTQRAGCRQAQHRRLPRLLLGCLTVLGDRLSAGAVGDLGPKGRGPRREPIDTPDTPVDRALGSGQGRRYGCERQN